MYEVIEATVKEKDKKQDKTIDNETINRTIKELTLEMQKAAELLQFELAAKLRDEINRLRGE